jgi:curved DNA-binding protein
MDFKDYYATLGVERTATQDEIKRAYRKLARKYHPDVSKEPDAEARFKEVAEAHEALIDAERRAAYDDIAQRQASGQPFEPPSGWETGMNGGMNGGPNSGAGSGFEFSGRGDAGMPRGAQGADFSDFFESLFGHAGKEQHARRRGAGAMPMQGADHHAKVLIDLLDSYRGAQRTFSLRMPVIDAAGHATFGERQLEVNIPKGVRQGQQLRLSGQGELGHAGAAAGDLYLEIQFMPDPVFRVDGRDVTFDLPVAPWEAALGATVTAPTPAGPVQLSIPPGSSQGRKLRLKGMGLPGKEPGDLYAVLLMALPPSGSPSEKDAYDAMARAFADFNPRSALEA